MMLILASISVVVWIAAVVLVLLNLRLVPRLGPDSKAGDADLPSLAVVIPARNEERDVEACVRALVEQDYPSFHVIVIDDQSTDRTGSILAAIASEHERLRVIDGQPPPDGWLGKPWALQQGASAASSELILFCDADVLYQPGALRIIVTGLLEQRVDGLSLLPKMEMRGFWEHVLMVQLPFTAFSHLPLFLSNSSQLPVLGVGGGPGNLIYRQTWERIGTHERLRSAVVDDIALMQLIRHESGSTGVAIAIDLVSVRMYRGFREIVNGFSKNVFHAMGGTLPRAFAALVMVVIFSVLPLVLVADGVLSVMRGGAFGLMHGLGLLAISGIVTARVVLFHRLGYRLDNALFGHPLMTAIWFGVMLWSIWKVGIRRQLVWRGRGYDARSARFGR